MPHDIIDGEDAGPARVLGRRLRRHDTLFSFDQTVMDSSDMLAAALKAMDSSASCDRRPREGVGAYLTRAASRAGRGPLFTQAVNVIRVTDRSGS